MKSLERRLASITAGTYTPADFIIADAKDADMAFGVAAAGPVPGARLPEGSPETKYVSRPDYQGAMRDIVAQGQVDILLASASNGEALATAGTFRDSSVTLAVRANDTSDIWHPRGSSYAHRASVPFRSANLAFVREFCDLVLYSITFNNDLEYDHASLSEYAKFREAARAAGVRHFLEVFNPNAPADLLHTMLGSFVNDHIIRTLAGVTSAERPVFLKMAYNGPRALSELVEHDPGLVVGILGGSAGTTRDTFELLSRAERYGARVALFGRKIQRCESQLDLVALMRPVLQGEISPQDAVSEYHNILGRKGITPIRSLDDDLDITDQALRLP